MLRVVIRKLQSAMIYAKPLFIDTLTMLTKRGRSHPERVLIVRLDGIGDFVLWVDAALAIVKYYKDQGKQVILLANSVWAGWASDLAIFDEVIMLERSRFTQDLQYRWKIGYRIRRLGCETAVQPSYSREWLLGDAAIRVSGAKERIGSSGDTSNIQQWQKRLSDRWYTRLIYSAPSPSMELLRNAEFVRGLTGTNFLAKLAKLPQIMGQRPSEVVDARIAHDGAYYSLFPGASWDGRRWPIANFAVIAARLNKKYGWQGVVCGGNGDCDLAEELCRMCDAPLLNLSGRTDLTQLNAILAHTKLLLTNETSAAHIGALCDIPTVCILGGGHFGRFMPYQVEQMTGQRLPCAVIHSMPCFGCDWSCIYARSKNGPTPCIERISVDRVWQAIGESLGNGSSPPNPIET
jgi:ADP-heptose:LPS heptosyltransferase